ncbi:MAG: Co2+/Mg2+ efflux protein ApaG [Magnetococcales bacterium]|nr:Co2+/Mg2+ efflux protein ApaG [Magnetococcales bacterium]
MHRESTSEWSRTDGRSSAIHVDVTTKYIAEQSKPEENRYVFSYTITIHNHGKVGAKLLTRHWIIVDADGSKQEVKGKGVVGLQPHLNVGEGFRYTSGTVLQTPAGSMRGSYRMETDDGEQFDAEIPVFTLSGPLTLH